MKSWVPQLYLIKLRAKAKKTCFCYRSNYGSQNALTQLYNDGDTRYEESKCNHLLAGIFNSLVTTFELVLLLLALILVRSFWISNWVDSILLAGIFGYLLVENRLIRESYTFSYQSPLVVVKLLMHRNFDYVGKRRNFKCSSQMGAVYSWLLHNQDISLL